MLLTENTITVIISVICLKFYVLHFTSDDTIFLLYGGQIFTDDQHEDWIKEMKNVYAENNLPINGIYEEGKYL